MPLVPCPDCGREISADAPACIHCGRPMAPASPAPPPRPVAGIAAVLVIGAISLIRVLMPRATTSADPDVADFRAVTTGLLLLGYTAAVIGALMAMMGNRAGNRVVRITSWLMLPASALLIALMWSVLNRIPGAEAHQGPLMALAGALLFTSVAPWLLFLFLFRRSKYG